jgi:zinc-binding alcohol dehydrogenase/oxidoreductase
VINSVARSARCGGERGAYSRGLRAGVKLPLSIDLVGLEERRSMHAAVLQPDGSLRYETVRDAAAGPGEAVVELRAAALNRRDILIRRGLYYDFARPLILGSDGAGILRDTGDEVIIYPCLRWGEGERRAESSWEILGGPSDGTFAELVAVPKANLFPRPRRLTWEEAAATPLAGLTAFRALFRVGGLVEGETLVILGAGGGVSTFALLLAVQAGARVFVTSSTRAKIDRAKEFGAQGGVVHTEDGWSDAILTLTGGGADVVLDSVGSTWGQSIRAARPGGRVVVLGATGGSQVHLDVRPFYLGWKSLLGTTMGSPRDFGDLVAYVETGAWRPVVDSVWPLADAELAHARLEASDHFGKVVLSVT